MCKYIFVKLKIFISYLISKSKVILSTCPEELIDKNPYICK